MLNYASVKPTALPTLEQCTALRRPAGSPRHAGEVHSGYTAPPQARTSPDWPGLCPLAGCRGLTAGLPRAYRGQGVAAGVPDAAGGAGRVADEGRARVARTCGGVQSAACRCRVAVSASARPINMHATPARLGHAGLARPGSDCHWIGSSRKVTQAVKPGARRVRRARRASNKSTWPAPVHPAFGTDGPPLRVEGTTVMSRWPRAAVPRP